MRCTSKRLISIVGVVALSASVLAGCGASDIEFDNKFNYLNSHTNESRVESIETVEADIKLFADDLCVSEDVFTQNSNVSDHVVEAMGVFLPAKGEVSYAKNIYQKMYPASVTKIMTAYLALTYGDMDSMVTASAKAVDQTADSSCCGLALGDQIRLGDLIYGLLLPSGNDAAIAIAEHISGSVDEFAALMNKTASEWGATGTHFVNPNGLHNDEHYTTVYDLYLIFSHCTQNEEFVKYISTKAYTAYFWASDGSEKVKTWTNTCRYVNGDAQPPSGIFPVGGKTGTTNPAGYCLCMMSKDANDDPVISIILHAGSRDDLYYVMTQALRACGRADE